MSKGLFMDLRWVLNVKVIEPLITLSILVKPLFELWPLTPHLLFLLYFNVVCHVIDKEYNRNILNIHLSFVYFYFLERKGVHWKAEHDPCSGKPSVQMTSQRIFQKLLSETHLTCFYSLNPLFLLKQQAIDDKTLFFSSFFILYFEIFWFKYLYIVSLYCYMWKCGMHTVSQFTWIQKPDSFECVVIILCVESTIVKFEMKMFWGFVLFYFLIDQCCCSNPLLVSAYCALLNHCNVFLTPQCCMWVNCGEWQWTVSVKLSTLTGRDYGVAGNSLLASYFHPPHCLGQLKITNVGRALTTVNNTEHSIQDYNTCVLSKIQHFGSCWNQDDCSGSHRYKEI